MNVIEKSKEAADKWAILLRRALPEAQDVEEAVLIADVAMQSLPADIKLNVLDDSGHEHKGKGPGGGQFTGHDSKESSSQNDSGKQSSQEKIDQKWKEDDINVSQSFRDNVVPRLEKTFAKNASKLKIDKTGLREMFYDNDELPTPEQAWDILTSGGNDDFYVDRETVFSNGGKLYQHVYNVAINAIDEDDDSDWEDGTQVWFDHQLQGAIAGRKDEIMPILKTAYEKTKKRKDMEDAREQAAQEAWDAKADKAKKEINQDDAQRVTDYMKKVGRVNEDHLLNILELSGNIKNPAKLLKQMFYTGQLEQSYSGDKTYWNLPKDSKLSIDAYFAWDIENRRAQGILNRTIAISKKMTLSARIDLEKALRTDDHAEMVKALLQFIQKYRLQLAELLTTTQLASLLEGAREVAKSIPTVPMFPSAANPPATLEPEKAIELLDQLQAMTSEEREKAIYELPADQQMFARQGLLARQQGNDQPIMGFTPQQVGDVEKVHYPIIDEAARGLAEKNVMSRADFDRLDAAARQKAFTIANVEAMDTMQKIRDIMAETIEQGVDIATFREKVLEAVDEGTFMSDAHLETVYRTNVQTAFSDGQMRILEHPFVQSGFPFAAYEAIHDDRARHDHLELETMGIEGTNIYLVRDPIFELFRPPWDFNCRCSWIPMTVRMAAARGLAYAKKWMEEGIEPQPPAFVAGPSFRPPPGFQRSISGAPLSIRLSLGSLDILNGGKGDNRPDSDFDPKQLAKGILVELEHTDNFQIAKEIAKDHLTESPNYYIDLAKMEAKEAKDA